MRPHSALSILALMFTALCWMGAGAAWAKGERVALVIGNTEYQSVAPLQNAGNDARGIAAALTDIGFEVDMRLDLTNAELSDAFRNFSRKSASSEIAVVYYAGHGIEIEKNNYLIPVDAELERATDVYFEAVPMENAMLAVEGASELSLVILDACRDNPFAATMRRIGATRSVGRGLALVEPSGNSLVAYAAKGGTTAFDGDGENSPYAKALIEALKEPDVELSLLFRRVRDDVLDATNGEQEPFVYGSLSAKELYLNPGVGVVEPPKPGAAEGVVVAHNSPQFDPAYVTWSAIESLERGENQKRALRAFIEEFADSRYAAVAKVMLRSYGEVPKDPPKGEGERALPVVGTPEVPEVDEPVDESPTGVDVALSREERRLVQRGLAAAGFATGGFDGLFGPKTRAAIVSWQDANALRVTSYLSKDQAIRLMEAGRSAAAVAAPKAESPTPSAPISAKPKDDRVASIAPTKPKVTGNNGTLHVDAVFRFREDGRWIIKNFVRAVNISNGKGQFKAKYSDIGKYGPFFINFNISGDKVTFSGEIVKKGFGATQTMINGNMNRTITLLQRGQHYKIILRVKFVPS